jgi:hypothetical protein
LWLARRANQMTLRELAGQLQIKRPANITMTVKRYEHKIRKDPSERATLERAAKMLNVAL